MAAELRPKSGKVLDEMPVMLPEDGAASLSAEAVGPRVSERDASSGRRPAVKSLCDAPVAGCRPMPL